MNGEERDAVEMTAENTAEKKGTGNRLRIIAVLLVLALLASGAGNIFLLIKYYEKRDLANARSDTNSEMYFYFDSLTVDSFKEKVASGEDFVVIIGRPGCGDCTRLEQPVIELARERNISDKIYYLNVERFRRDGDAWAQFKDIYKFEGTPTYARFANGKALSNVGWTPESDIYIEMVGDWLDKQSDFFSTQR